MIIEDATPLTSPRTKKSKKHGVHTGPSMPNFFSAMRMMSSVVFSLVTVTFLCPADTLQQGQIISDADSDQGQIISVLDSLCLSRGR